MSILVDHAAEAVAAAYVQVGDSVLVGDRLGDCPQRSRLVHGLVGSVLVVVGLELAQGVA